MPGVRVICFVVSPSTEVTKTSPLAMKATSLPSGDTAIPPAPPVTMTTSRLFVLASAERVIWTFSGEAEPRLV